MERIVDFIKYVLEFKDGNLGMVVGATINPKRKEAIINLLIPLINSHISSVTRNFETRSLLSDLRFGAPDFS